jgi:hypothetical protein
MSLRQFVYLDEYKMYSLAAQIFEGLVEDAAGTRQSAESGTRILAALEKRREDSALQDYAYTVFERELGQRSRVLEIDGGAPAENLADAGFVKVRGKAVITDLAAARDTLGRFNEIGEALTYVTNAEAIGQAKEVLQKFASIKDRNKKAVMADQVKKAADVQKLAREGGLRQDPDFLKHMGELVSHGLGQHVEIRLAPEGAGGRSFSAILDRRYLRDDAFALVKKYARYTLASFTVVGLVSQFGSASGEAERASLPQVARNIKEGLMIAINALVDVDKAFLGVADTEVVIDPIAVYREVL